MTNTTDPSATVHENAPTLRLVWPRAYGAHAHFITGVFFYLYNRTVRQRKEYHDFPDA